VTRFRFSRRAEADIEEISDFIARDNPGRAASFVAELRTRCCQLAEHLKAALLHPDQRRARQGVSTGSRAESVALAPDCAAAASVHRRSSPAVGRQENGMRTRPRMLVRQGMSCALLRAGASRVIACFRSPLMPSSGFSSGLYPGK
jgi:plasmid stabilization system protein ParE